MKRTKAAVAVLIALISAFAVSVSVFAHHGGGHHGVYRSVNYCVCGSNYVDANNNGICDNCNYICGSYSNYGHHRSCWH